MPSLVLNNRAQVCNYFSALLDFILFENITRHTPKNPLSSFKEKQRRGRQMKRWEDNIKKCTGMDFANTFRAAAKTGLGEADCCNIICGAPTTFQGYGID